VQGAYVAASGGFISIAVAIRHVGLACPRSQERRNLWLGTLGDGRPKVKGAGLLGPDGVVLGKLERDLSAP
jgi:type IV secretion system protein VirD4